MAQFDVYENEEPESKDLIPFLMDVQHDLHNGLATRTVVPLVLIFSAKEEAKKLCPRFKIMGKDVVMSTPEIAGYPKRDLHNKVASLAENRTEILTAIDFLLSGF
ncbi:MAG: CcdB family protein [Deltaproteobacteria bacterium]|nr:CcdB family protein [Deltaproteobacteria bacterium]MBW2520256.1 CcdB family protein [Deltaproteobacteria bacterium]